jgi:hypothetical protein
VCPCHALVGVVAVLSGSAVLSPAAQDGLHAVYVPAAVLAGAALLRLGRKPRSAPSVPGSKGVGPPLTPFLGE